MEKHSVYRSSSIVHSELVEKVQSKRISTGEHLGIVSDLGKGLDIEGLRIHQEVLYPGRRSSPLHRHLSRWELVYVLSGTPSVRIKKEATILEEGELVSFSPKNNDYHMIFNDSDEIARLLVVSVGSDDDEVLYMPD